MSVRTKFWIPLIVSLGCFGSSAAHAHFKLLKPASWLDEDAVGGPQKGSPCGPGGMGLLGDDVQPVPKSDDVTTFTAGEKITVELEETIYHPGYFRIALAPDRATFKDPPVDNPSSCAVDLAKVPTGPHDGYVLMDGLFKATDASAANRKLTQEITLPNEPCDKCTLQVVQVMKDHGLSSCYYFHCADIKIVAAGGSAGSAGMGGAPAAGAAAGASAGAGAAGAGGMSGGSGTTGGAGMSGAGAGRGAVVAGSPAAASGTGGSPLPVAGIGSTASPMTSAGASAPAGIAGMSSTIAGAAGSATPNPAPTSDSSSCSVRQASGGAGSALSWGALALASCGLIRRRRVRARAHVGNN